MNNREWLENLKVGAEVIHSHKRSLYASQTLNTVERLTKTQIILDDGTKFRKANGHSVGTGDWNFTHIEPATEELKNKIKENKILSKMRTFINKSGLVQLTSISKDKDFMEDLISVIKKHKK